MHIKPSVEKMKSSEMNSDKVAGMIALIFVVLTGFGGVMTYLTGKDSNSLKREIDIRIANVVENVNVTNDQIKNIHENMAVDDLREQKDAVDKGHLQSEVLTIKGTVSNLDNELQKIHLRNDDRFTDLSSRVSELETFTDM